MRKGVTGPHPNWNSFRQSQLLGEGEAVFLRDEPLVGCACFRGQPRTRVPVGNTAWTHRGYTTVIIIIMIEKDMNLRRRCREGDSGGVMRREGFI